MVSLHFKQYTSQINNTPLVIMHGLFGMLDNWHTLSNKFSEYQTVYALDLRNHGKSPHHPDSDFELFVDDLINFLESQNIKQIHLLGHSLGGKVAMEFSFKYPERLDKLLIADIAPKQYPPYHTHIIEALHSLDLDTLQSRKEAENQLLGANLLSAEIQFILKNLVREGDRFVWKMNLEALYRNYYAFIDEVNPKGVFEGETIFIRGGNSKYITAIDLDRMLRQFPNHQLVTIEGAGHWVHAEQPDLFFNAVKTFLNS